MAPLRQIVAFGGGGFLMEPENPLLDDYVLGLAKKPRPKVCFLATASGDSPSFLTRFYDHFPAARAEASHLPLFFRGRQALDPMSHLCSQDVIYVGGGNTLNMLSIWRLHGVDRALRAAYERGVIMAGISAGMICWFQGCCTDSYGPLAPLHEGLGWLSGSACPHYNGEADRRALYHRFIREGLPEGVAADDGAALHFVNEQLHACVASQPRAKCYRITLRNAAISEDVLHTRYLGPA